MAIVCDKLGVDVWEVIDAAATKPFGFMRFLPGPGLGGHCIPIDPHYLAWKMRGLNYKTRFVDLAGEVNTEMPLFWIRKVTDQLNIHSKSVRGANVLVLGVAYKRDVEDIRESPALDIINLLEGQGAEVRYHDPNVPELNHDGKVYRSVTLTPDEVRHADCVIIVTDHTNVDYDMVRQNAQSVVDTRNVLGRTSSTSP
jgi:UDP-N-acetyl-D-glucosamine dehydrogenase